MKKRPPFENGAIALTVALAMVLAAAPAFAEGGAAEEGAAQGKADAHSSGWWFFSGLILPGIGIVLPLLFTPDAPMDALIGKSPEYVEAYTKAYARKVRCGNVLWALGGTATTGIVGVVLIASATAKVGNSCISNLNSSCSTSGANQACAKSVLAPAVPFFLL